MLNKLQNEALYLAITGHNLLINGSNGTGKTNSINEITKQTDRNWQNNCDLMHYSHCLFKFQMRVLWNEFEIQTFSL